jgi:hypothetical protein
MSHNDFELCAIGVRVHGGAVFPATGPFRASGGGMVLAVDIWLLPAIAAGSSSYLVSLLWERFRAPAAPGGIVAAFLSGLSFIMGAICAYYRATLMARSLENNVIVMFIAGASATFLWLLFRRFFPGSTRHS